MWTKKNKAIVQEGIQQCADFLKYKCIFWNRFLLSWWKNYFPGWNVWLFFYPLERDPNPQFLPLRNYIKLQNSKKYKTNVLVSMILTTKWQGNQFYTKTLPSGLYHWFWQTKFVALEFGCSFAECR